MQKQLVSSQDVVDAINLGQEKANQNSINIFLYYLIDLNLLNNF